MPQTNKQISIVPLFFSLLLILAGSCVGYKKTLYFQGEEQTIAPVNISETYKLKKGDILQINIFTPDSESSEILNIESDETDAQADAYFTSSFINDSGYVELPLTGKIYVAGYTVMQVDSIVTVKAKDYFNFYTVDVKLASFKFMALGEFANPGQYFVPNESCTIYEALAIAGDAGEYANKEKIQLIRTLEDGSKKIMHIDLTGYAGFTQENYYIQPGDIIYIQPQKAKVDKVNLSNVTIVVGLFSVVVLIMTRLN